MKAGGLERTNSFFFFYAMSRDREGAQDIKMASSE